MIKLPPLPFEPGYDVLVIRERDRLSQPSRRQKPLIDPRYETVLIGRRGETVEDANLLVRTDVRSAVATHPEEKGGKLSPIALTGTPPMGRFSLNLPDLNLEVSVRSATVGLGIDTRRPTLVVQGGTLAQLESAMRAELGSRFHYPSLEILERALNDFNGGQFFHLNMPRNSGMLRNDERNESTGPDQWAY